MPTYRVKEKSFIDNKLYEAGSEVEYSGIPHKNLESLDKNVKTSAKADEADRESALRTRAAAAGVDVNDADAFAKWKAEDAGKQKTAQ